MARHLDRRSQYTAPGLSGAPSASLCRSWLFMDREEEEQGKFVENDVITYENILLCVHHSCKCLPGDVLVDILLRLPVKSLMRFKCVSKTWNRLIICSKFVAMHLNLSCIRNQGCLLVQGLDRAIRLPLHYTLPTKHFWGLQVNMPDSYIVGCSHGLVCFSNLGDQFWIWNPATRNLASLQPLIVPGAQKFWTWDHSRCKNVEIGFSFLPQFNNIKLAVLHYLEPKIHLFTWSTGNWKTIEASLLSSIRWFTRYCFNDKYWIGVGGGKTSSPGKFAVYFDMIEETLGLVKCPSGIISPRFTSWKQSLTLFAYQHCNLNWLLDVWILNEASSEEIPWMKLFTIQTMGGPSDYKPKGFWADGCIVFRHVDSDQELLYDPDTQQVKGLQFERLQSVCNFFPYYESLIPLKS